MYLWIDRIRKFSSSGLSNNSLYGRNTLLWQFLTFFSHKTTFLFVFTLLCLSSRKFRKLLAEDRSTNHPPVDLMAEILGLAKTRLAYWKSTGLPSNILMESTGIPEFRSWLVCILLCFSTQRYENMEDWEQKNTQW